MGKRDHRAAQWQKVASTPHFVFLTSGKATAQRKFAVVAPKRTGKAVARNCVKRLLREFYRTHKELFGANRFHVVRIKKIPEKDARKAATMELERSLREHIRR